MGDGDRWGCGGALWAEPRQTALDCPQSATQSAAQGATFTPGTPEALFQTHAAQEGPWPQYDVARDGRFLINTDLTDTTTEPIHVLLNWKPPAK